MITVRGVCRGDPAGRTPAPVRRAGVGGITASGNRCAPGRCRFCTAQALRFPQGVEALSSGPREWGGPVGRVTLQTIADQVGVTVPLLAMGSTVSGVIGDGFMTIVQPAAMAGAILCAERFSGKLNGVMAAITPTGSRT